MEHDNQKLAAILADPNMSWDDLYQLRLQYPNNTTAQNQIAPVEHQAWAREQGRISPLHGLVTGAMMAPTYEAIKALGLDKYLGAKPEFRSDPSLGSVAAGLKGGLLGSLDWMQNKFAK